MALSRTDYAVQATDSGGTGPFTTASLSIPASSLIVICVCATTENGSGDVAGNLTVNSPGLTFTSRAQLNSGGWATGMRVWTAPDSSGGNRTFTIDCGALNNHSYKVFIHAFTGYNTSTPVGGSGTGTDSDGIGPGSLTLSASPASTSHVLGWATTILTANSGNITQGASFTELAESITTAWMQSQSQVRTGSTSSTVDWADMCSGNGGGTQSSIMLGLEIVEGGGTQTLSVTGTGGVALAGTATALRARSATGQGGVLLSGTADYDNTSQQTFSYTGSGGLVFGGSAGYSNLSVQHFTYTGTGGVVLSGSAPQLRRATPQGSGSVLLGGVAEIVPQPVSVGGFTVSSRRFYGYIRRGR